MQNAYSYFAWNTSNGAGRLKMITAGTVADANKLLDLRYYSGTDTSNYDPVGNLQTIYRYDTNNGLLETQSFTYDYLDRLLTASANGSAPYSEGYVYDTYSGNLANKSSVGNYTYNAPRQGACSAGTNSSIPHAVAAAGGNGYTYDCNGNMLSRPGQALTFDAENRLVGVSGSATASFTYNGDGQRVIATVGGMTTVFIGEYLEWTGSTSTMKSYYYTGGRRIAMRSGSGGALSWLIGDHLGSTTVVADSSGGTYSTQLYRAFGEVRPGPGNTLATRYTFTGQADDGIGLMYYRARYMDNKLGRFISADTVVSSMQDSASFDRYAYGRNSPLRYRDPSGHVACDDDGTCTPSKPVTNSKPPSLTLDDYKEIFSDVYGVTLNDGGGLSWTIDKARSILNYLAYVNAALKGKFKEVFNGLILKIASHTAGNYKSEVSGMSMTIYWGTTPPNYHIYHELGHVFDNVYGDKISNRLGQSTIYDSEGTFIMGVRNGNYDRQSGLGYNPPCPSAKPCSTEQHPRSWEPDGNTADEEWADLFMNNIAGTFANDSAGRTRQSWTSSMIYLVMNPAPAVHIPAE